MANTPFGQITRNVRRRPLAAALAALCITTLGAAEPATRPTDPAASSLLAGMAQPLPLVLPRAPATPHVGPPRAPTNLFVANCADSGPGSLRDVINDAESGDTVDMSQLTCSTISITTGSIKFAQDQLALVGPGRHHLTIDGGADENRDGVLVHLGFGTLLVEDLTIANGSKYRSSDVSALGGCIQSQGNVLVRGSAVTGCRVRSESNRGALGGGIWTQGITNLQHSEISGNRVFAAGNGYASGGGVYALGGFSSLYSVITGNQASSPSTTPSFGGGVFARGYGGVFETTVANNSAARMGGLALADDFGTNQSFIFQSTVSGNQATLIGGAYSRRPLYLYNSTIARNVSVSSVHSGTGQHMAAGLQMGAELLTFHSTILADNISLDAAGYNDLDGKPGVNTTGTHNLITGTPLPPPPDTIGFTPALGPLQDNGGLVPTHALIPGESYAIDAGGLPTVGTFSNDTRGTGFARWIGASVDIGSFEHDPDRIFTNGFDFGVSPLPAQVAAVTNTAVD